ncbi:MAG: crossover junction endodeoxyribonuclease RuvC [Actinomycetota bacterium]
MTSVLALDLSATKAGVAWPDGSVEVLVPGNAVGVRANRLHWWYATTRRRIAGLKRAPDVVVVEEPAYNKAGQSGVQAAAMVRGAVALACCHEIGEDRWVDITNSSIKKYATGKGNADKNAVKAACRKRLPWNGESEDEADALWLWALTMHALGSPVVEVPQTHQDALPKVRQALARVCAVPA